jgi:hypothetical protein
MVSGISQPKAAGLLCLGGQPWWPGRKERKLGHAVSFLGLSLAPLHGCFHRMCGSSGALPKTSAILDDPFVAMLPIPLA